MPWLPWSVQPSFEMSTQTSCGGAGIREEHSIHIGNKTARPKALQLRGRLETEFSRHNFVPCVGPEMKTILR